MTIFGTDGMAIITTNYEILIGNYGSGKTELALNFALDATDMGQKTTLCDIDIVNPYFRSSALDDILVGKGIDVITTKFAGSGVDVPSLPAEFTRIFFGDYDCAVVDVGGDSVGARVLGRYLNDFISVRKSVNVNLVVNANRPLTSTVFSIISMYHSIKDAMRLDIDCLINNTNLAEETTAQTVIEGHTLIEEAGRKIQKPIRYITATKMVAKALSKEKDYGQLIREVSTYMRPDWLKTGYSNH